MLDRSFFAGCHLLCRSGPESDQQTKKSICPDHVMTNFFLLFFLLAVITFGEAFTLLRPGRPAISTKVSSSVQDEVVTTMLPGKLPWKPEGYNTWLWRSSTGSHKINYVDFVTESNKDKPPLLLIHGFGASCYHWRYNIPTLARDYRVYAIDLLGFGLSDKPIIDYTAEVWRDQTLAFIEEIVKTNSKRPCVVAGNSLGGFTALYAASSPEATSRRLINGCALLNAAGSFRDQLAAPKPPDAEWIAAIKAAIQRFVIGVSFIYTKQPARIEQVLRQVYPVDSTNVDQELVASIQYPAQDPNAPEVFYRVIVKNGNGPPKQVDDLLEVLQVPLLLLWGMADPWIRPAAADKIEALFPKAQRVNVNAGHCPHDEAPMPVNAALKAFVQSCN